MDSDALALGSKPCLAGFADLIAAHTGTAFLADEHMRSSLSLWAERMRGGKVLDTIYAPFEHIEAGARLVIVGITPGATQADNALAAARAALRRGTDIATAAREAKVAASFSGGMRSNLCRMLDAVGVPGWLGVPSGNDVFGLASHLVHFTSALRNPVFVDRKNYNGTPEILHTPRLIGTVQDSLAEEARALPDAMWLPLWDVPATALDHLVRIGILRADRVLPPMPHPAGGNGENIAWFTGQNRKDEFSSRRASTGQLLLDRRDDLRRFFSSSVVKRPQRA